MPCAQSPDHPLRIAPWPRRGRPKPVVPNGGLQRRLLLTTATAGLAVPSLPRFARAGEITWRLGHNAPPDFPLHLRLLEAAVTIATQSAGEMKLEVYPNNELGGSVGLFAQLRAGTVDVVPVTSQLLGSNMAFGSLPMLGFAFADYDAVWTALDGDLGGYIRAQMKERLGLIAMSRCWNFGFRQVTTGSKVIKDAADIEGLRLRTPPEADFIGLLQALRVLPVSVPINGLARAMKSHAIDGQEGVLGLVKAAKLYEEQTVCARTNHVWDGHWMCISGKSWANLPPNLKDVVVAAFDEGAVHQRQDTASNDAKVQQDLETLGMKFHTVDGASFRQVLRKAGYYAAWQAKMGDDSWAALEKYTGRLT
jgi:TRAP-type C4-dicarboxylate transport system substrate-binding protein